MGVILTQLVPLAKAEHKSDNRHAHGRIQVASFLIAKSKLLLIHSFAATGARSDSRSAHFHTQAKPEPRRQFESSRNLLCADSVSRGSCKSRNLRA